MKSVVKKNAFTIMELLVAMTLLVMLLGLSGMVFHTTVAAHRAAGATIDVTRTLNAVRGQLNADFQGLQKDAPLFIWFNAVDANGDTVPDTHYDAIHFFANGDFQTMRQYADKTIYGNIARVYYGHANSIDLAADPAATPDFNAYNALSRKSHILTADGDIYFNYGEIPEIGSGVIDYTQFPGDFGEALYNTTDTPPKTYTVENALEFNTITLNNWIAALNFLDAGLPNNADHFIANCMSNHARPFVDLEDINTLHLLLAQGVVQMQIQFAYTADDLAVPGMFPGVRWWPSVDPAGDGLTASDFDTMGQNQFGVYFTLPGGSSYTNWFDVVSADPDKRCKTDNGFGGDLYFKDDFYPRALKFTFVLKDSNGVFADGKTFTHIVYLDN